jgi:hypothetical protein
MARMRIAVLDWATDTPRVTDATADAPGSPGAGPAYASGDPELPRLAVTGSGQLDPARLAPLEATLDAALSHEMDDEIDLSDPVTVIVMSDESDAESVPVSNSSDRSTQIDEGVRELFRSRT